MIFQLSTFSGICWMGYLNLVGLRFQKLVVQRLHFTRSSANSDRWKWVAIDPVCQSTASLRSATSLASIFGGNCKELVLWCFKTIWMLSWFKTCLLSGLSFNSISGEVSLRVASRLYCFAGWGCNRPWKSGGGISMRAEFCASSSIHTEKLFSWDWDQHVKHCRCCHSCCSTKFWVWSLESNWCRGWPRNCRS